MTTPAPNIVVNSSYGPIIVNAHDRFIAQQIISTGYWAQADIDLIRKIIEFQLQSREQVRFYDVGANFGTHSLALAKIFGNRITVRVFEAQRAIFHMLCGTVALNNLGNVSCHHNAVSDSSGDMLEISLPNYGKPNNFGGFELMEPVLSDNASMERSGETDSVSTVTLDSFAEKVDFIKMDIEGMEVRGMAGAQQMIEASRPICFVETVKTDKEALFAFFRTRDYTIYLKTADAIIVPSESKLKINGLEVLD